MIQLSNVSLQRGIKVLFENANLTINPGHKLGLVGANGTGKSSLFKLLLGELHQDQGDLQVPAHWTLAHMAQEVSSTDCSALDYILDGDKPLRAAEAAIKHAEDNHLDTELAHAHDLFSQANGYTAKSRAEQLLSGLGFLQSDVSRPVSDFSGGWRLRLNLAQALMSPSDLLLLDEPTNHLDLDAVFWLEQWVKNYPGTLIIISHDRDFLDSIVGSIAHVEQQKINSYKGNYSSFEIARAEQLAQQQAQHEKQEREIAHMQSFIDRFKAKATKAKQAQSRVKAMERMTRIAPAHVDTQFSFTFPQADNVSSPLLSIEEGEMGYAGNKIVSTSCTILPEMRIGLLGANGAGKSTLIKSLVGDLPLLEGSMTEGAHLHIGYFAQHQLEALDVSTTPLVHIQRLSPTASEQSIRNFLGSFGFNGERATDTVKLFSGGEKARLALSLIAWKKPNLLIMDEPTNHLDMESRFALTVALQDFEGAIIVVSHDRHLLKNTVDEFWLVHDKRVEPFKGDLDDYHLWLKNQKKAEQASKSETDRSETQTKPSVDKKAQRKREAEIRASLQPVKKKISQLEKEIEKYELRLSSINDQLNDTELYTDECKTKLTSLLQEQAEIKQNSVQLEADWLEQQELLEQQEQQLRQSD